MMDAHHEQAQDNESPRVSIASLPSIEADARASARRAGLVGYSNELSDAIGRLAEASVRLHEKPAHAPTEKLTDRWQIEDAEAARRQKQFVEGKVREKADELERAEEQLSMLPAGRPRIARLAVYVALGVMALLGTVATAGLFTVSLHLAFVEPYLAGAYNIPVAQALSGPISALFGVFVAGALTWPFPFAVALTAGRTNWSFKCSILVFELVLAGALGILRHGKGGGWIEVLCVSAVEAAIIVTIGAFSLAVGTRLKAIDEYTHKRRACLRRVEMLRETIHRFEAQIQAADATKRRHERDVSEREDAARHSAAAVELARATAALGYAGEAASMVDEAARVPGETSLAGLLQTGRAVERSVIEGRQM